MHVLYARCIRIVHRTSHLPSWISKTKRHEEPTWMTWWTQEIWRVRNATRWVDLKLHNLKIRLGCKIIRNILEKRKLIGCSFYNTHMYYRRIPYLCTYIYILYYYLYFSTISILLSMYYNRLQIHIADAVCVKSVWKKDIVKPPFWSWKKIDRL